MACTAEAQPRLKILLVQVQREKILEVMEREIEIRETLSLVDVEPGTAIDVPMIKIEVRPYADLGVPILLLGLKEMFLELYVMPIAGHVLILGEELKRHAPNIRGCRKLIEEGLQALDIGPLRVPLADDDMSDSWHGFQSAGWGIPE